jgi:hypothetical protein
MTGRRTTRLAPVLWGTALALLLPAAGRAHAAGLADQGPKGHVIVVSNVPQRSQGDLITSLRPRSLEWVDVTADRAALKPSSLPLSMVLFVIRSGRPVPLDPSWGPCLPASASDLAKPSTTIASQAVKVEGQKLACVCALLMAPTRRLLEATIAEAQGLDDLPTKRPLVRRPGDLGRTHSVAVLPSIARPGCQAMGTAAEAELTQGLVSLGCFRIVGREALSNEGPRSRTDPDRLAAVGRSLGVDAVAVVTIATADTTCTAQTRYDRTSKKATSSEAMDEFKRWKAQQEAAGKTVKKKGPDDDLVYAAPYTALKHTTHFTGELQFVGVASGEGEVALALEDEGAVETATAPVSQSYRWYKISFLDSDDSLEERTYPTNLRTVDAVALVRRVMQKVPGFLETRVMLPEARGLRDDEAGNDTGAAPGTTGQIVLIEGDDIYANLGRADGLRAGDVLTVTATAPPQYNKALKSERTAVTRLKVAEAFIRTCRCTILDAASPASLEVGTDLEVE